MDNDRLSELFARYHKGSASQAETDELMEMLRHLPDETLVDLLQATWNHQPANQDFFSPDTRTKFLEALPAAVEEPAKLRFLDGRRGLLLRVAAAAAVLLVLSLTAVSLLRSPDTTAAQNPPTKKTPLPSSGTIVPGRDQAVLTLADGRQIVLDTAANGSLVQEGGVKVIKLGGRLTYDVKQGAAEVLYNTISTPKGGQYQLELADGTKVWLNAASSLRFPAAFTGKTRAVELTGEGYFEVAHNAAVPFHVKVNDADVQVLGTHFNINSYSDEPDVRTTLLEGKVLVTKADRVATLSPGQQAILRPGGEAIRVTNDVNLEEVMAWKDGKFLFNSADIETVMRQISRWYDVDVVYERHSSETITGGLPRSESVTKLLRILEATGKVGFEIKGKQIIVEPK